MKCECKHLDITHVYWPAKNRTNGLDRGHCLALNCVCVQFTPKEGD